jgi:uncharacterized hydrophobic protein (TIGR00271 family)
MEKSVLGTDIFKQKRATEKLVEESRADLDFYVFLCASVFITTLGLAIDNPIVIVGAMLVAPMLYPILALGLGVVTSSTHAIARALRIIGQSGLIAVAIAFVTAFLVDIHSQPTTEQLELLIDPNLALFFLASLAAGVVASFSWVTQKTALSFPGVAITVSLVPPVAAVGVALALWSRELFIGSAMLFVVNLLGVVLASVVVFSLFGFQRVRVWEDQKIRKQEEDITKKPTDNGDITQPASDHTPEDNRASTS